MNKIKLIIFLIFLALTASSKDIRVGLFGSTTQTKADVFYKVGRYEFYSESKNFTIISRRGDKISFVARGNKVNAYLNGLKVGENIWFRLNKRSDKNSLEVSNGTKKKEVMGNLVIYSINGKLKIVNEISIDSYVEGVIKGEAGYGYSLEYYKVQAVISRTYALHHQKHKGEGFELCDHTHCQVYDGINTKEEIKLAVIATSEEVLVDSSMNFINTLFHSNCGGQTVTTDMVWSKRLACMESISDTFCTHSSQANWKKTISKSSWIRFLSQETKKTSSYLSSINLDFNQTQRKEFYSVGSAKVRLTKIRKKFRLKSTFFSVHIVGDKVVFIGKGYGHGVGLCQEGGIVMAKTHNYQEVLYHYYKDVSIMSISKVEYYRLF
jgi:stage II sporulation protein D